MKNQNIAILGGRLIDSANKLDTIQNLYIADGKICQIGKAPENFNIGYTINAKGLIVTPGFIDLNFHIREPGLSYKGTIAEETFAAAKGGSTHLCIQPTTNPVIDNVSVIELIQQRSLNAGFVKILPIAAMTKDLDGKLLSEYATLKQRGCIGISHGNKTIEDTQILKNCFDYAANYDIPIFVKAKDPYLAKNSCIHSSLKSSLLGLPSQSDCVETLDISRYLRLAEQCNVRLHFCCISAKRSIELINEAKKQGLQITSDVAAHHLHLNVNDIKDYNSNFHLNPPLRTEYDQLALQQALLKSQIQAISSDHQPHELAAKYKPFQESSSGASTTETLLSLTLSYGNLHNLDLISSLSFITSEPAKILKIKNKQLKLGHIADLCIFDHKKSWKVSTETIISKGKNSPFMGQEMQGEVCYTLLNGVIVYAK